ncbi:unnamed protein product [Cercospora beticola]|nr:unnamed protein product [Cercospora beticola]
MMERLDQVPTPAVQGDRCFCNVRNSHAQLRRHQLSHDHSFHSSRGRHAQHPKPFSHNLSSTQAFVTPARRQSPGLVDPCRPVQPASLHTGHYSRGATALASEGLRFPPSSHISLPGLCHTSARQVAQFCNRRFWSTVSSPRTKDGSSTLSQLLG